MQYMKSIYPKVDSHFRGIRNLKKYIDKYKGVEVQVTSIDENGTFCSSEFLRSLCNICPNLKEITIHTPSKDYDLEMVLYRDKNIIFEQLTEIKELSQELGIRINLLYHTRWNLSVHKECTILHLKELLSFIKGYNVSILLENSYMNLERECNALKLCKFMGDFQLKTCINLSHICCLANIYRVPVSEFISKYLKKEECIKYVHQVHFSHTANEDGYRDYNKTHAVAHETLGDLVKDMELLYAYGMYDCIFVTNIREQNYDERKDQVMEIENMEDIYMMLK